MAKYESNVVVTSFYHIQWGRKHIEKIIDLYE